MGASSALALVGGGGLLLGLLALWLFKPWQREHDPQQRLLRRYEALLLRHGVRRDKGEGVRAFAERAAQRLPQQAQAIDAFARAFEAQRYAGQPASPSNCVSCCAACAGRCPGVPGPPRWLMIGNLVAESAFRRTVLFSKLQSA